MQPALPARALCLWTLLVMLVGGACGQQPAAVAPAPAAPIRATIPPAPAPTRTPRPEPTPLPTRPRVAPIVTRAPDARAARVDRLFRAIAANAPGAAVIITRDGEVLYMQGYGQANRKSRARNTPQTMFHLASVGKQFTALALMMLQEEGRLDYDDPIAAHMPELAALGNEVTIRRLLTHTSGMLGHDSDEDDFYSALLDEIERPTVSDELALLAEWEADDLLAHTPGERFDYSNIGYEILGALVERLSGQSYPDFVRERIFEPVGMTNSFSRPDTARLALPHRARGYDVDGERYTLNDADPLDELVGSGSVYASVEDMARYEWALTTGALVRPATLTEAFEPTTLTDGSLSPYGFGWELSEDPDLPYVGHSGAWVGFLSYYLRFPEERLAIIVLSNRSDIDPERLAFKIADIYR